jgi:hypothetical protein
MMRKLYSVLGALALLAGLAVGGKLLADTGFRMPVPAGVFSANEVVYANDTNTLTGSSVVKASNTGLTLGASGTALTQIAVLTATVTSIQVAGNQCDEIAYTVSGVTTSDKILWNTAYAQDAEPVPIVGARAAATDTVELTFCNVNSASSDPVTGTVNLIAIRS